jgi:hypothetical protein
VTDGTVDAGWQMTVDAGFDGSTCLAAAGKR